MRLVSIDRVKPGDKLARSVYSPSGQLILAAGTTLLPSYISRLVSQGIASLYIADSLDESDLNQLLTREIREEVIRWAGGFVNPDPLLAACGDTAAQLIPNSDYGSTTGPVDRTSTSPRTEHTFPPERRRQLMAKIRQAVDLLISEVLSQPETVIGMIEIKSMMDYTMAHSVQVAIDSIILGREMGISGQDLRDLATGALLHDIGKAAISDDVWNKPGPLSSEERQVVRGHPELGFHMLKEAGVGILPAHIAWQHHERWDGSGYPRRLSGKEILPLASICMVCDVFDAMTSDRPYKKAYHPYQSLGFINDNQGNLFEPSVVRALGDVVAPYPVASQVVLSTGEVAVVKRLNSTNIARPVVVVTRDKFRRFYQSPKELDLSQNDSTSIVGFYS